MDFHGAIVYKIKVENIKYKQNLKNKNNFNFLYNDKYICGIISKAF